MLMVKPDFDGFGAKTEPSRLKRLDGNAKII
jgi:hypothetical protein